MRIRLRYLVIAGAVAAIVGAPTAGADDTNPTCTDITGAATECSSPGNVQISAAPPVTQDPFTLPYWDEVFGGSYPGPYPVPYAEGSR